MHLVIFGLGFSGTAVARLAAGRGVRVSATSRDAAAAVDGVAVLPFGAALPGDVTHVLATAPPGEAGYSAPRAYGAALGGAASLRWAGYLSTTGVYGDRGGGWVDEGDAAAPGQARSRRRVAAEGEWAALAGRVAVDLFRVAGILRARAVGAGRCAVGPGAAGGEAGACVRAGACGRHCRGGAGGGDAGCAGRGAGAAPGRRRAGGECGGDRGGGAAAGRGAAAGVLVRGGMGGDGAAMARSFWAENRKVSSARTQEVLGYRWRYPSYREGLRAILAAGG